MTTFSYFISEPTVDQGSYYGDVLQGEWKSIPFKKSRQYQLYYVPPIEGKQLLGSLAGNFTQLILLQKAIDKYLLSNPGGVNALPDIPPSPPARRVHRKKQDMEDEGNNFEASDD
jgi:hypothetical protein